MKMKKKKLPEIAIGEDSFSIYAAIYVNLYIYDYIYTIYINMAMNVLLCSVLWKLNESNKEGERGSPQ